jgi:hypothetical protein
MENLELCFYQFKGIPPEGRGDLNCKNCQRNDGNNTCEFFKKPEHRASIDTLQFLYPLSTINDALKRAGLELRIG